MVEGARVVFTSSVLRSILLLAWTGAAFAVVPEGLAAIYAKREGHGATTFGLLVAAMPAGFMVGALLIGRLAPSRRLRLMRPLAAATFVPLVLTGLHPPIWGAVVLWALSGVAMCYQLPANATFMLAVPGDARGRAFGLAQAGIQALQGVAIAGAGALAILLDPHQVVALAGLCGLAGIALISAQWPTERLAGVYGEQEDIGTLGDVPIESTTPLPDLPVWTGPYPLTPRRRVLVGRLFRYERATQDSSEPT